MRRRNLPSERTDVSLEYPHMSPEEYDSTPDASSAAFDQGGEKRAFEGGTAPANGAGTSVVRDRTVQFPVATRTTRERLTIAGFVAIGVFCFAAGFVVSAGREVLFSLGGIGLFASVLTYGVTGTRSIEARDGAEVYKTCATNLEAITATFGSNTERIYVPNPDGVESEARLFVPAAVDGGVQDAAGFSIVDSGERGLVLEPTGATLFREFERALDEPVATSPELLVEQLTDSLKRRFEFVTDADATVRPDERVVTITISGSVFGPLDQFDHPVASFLAVGLAVGLDRRISFEATALSNDGTWVLEYR
ncbi:hypothetical protein [Natronosalvus rutilus]|uniref:DUF7982 domain-containing protein n=1 Tax=Natronosalvus rutilus TaxID=2953753 RepID=A0A9E7STS8_9EURY|nr:hypothetical protein [Natronosalvus rutilus]UTF52077.1 hypothetical protein NGM29_09675 [Natronosalvus rutilus]